MDTISPRSRSGIFGNGFDSPDILMGEPVQSGPAPLDPAMGGAAPEYPVIPRNDAKGGLDPTIGNETEFTPLGDMGMAHAESLGLPERPQAQMPMQQGSPQPRGQVRPQQGGDMGQNPGTQIASSSATGAPSGDMNYLTPFFSIRPNTGATGPVGLENMNKTLS